MAGLVVERGGRAVTIYEPLPHQARIHASTKRYVLASGSRGTGKSICLRFDAYMHALSIPRFRAVVLRRTTGELKSSHLTFVPFEAEQMGLPAGAWHSTDMVLRFPNGSTVKFGHAEDDASLSKFLSSEAELILIDELATFTFNQFSFIQTSLRSPIPGYKPQVKGGTNPVGVGAEWVKRYFITQDYTTEELPGYDRDEIEVIHSHFSENTHIDTAQYGRVLDNLGSPALRAALKDGSWDAVEGQAFPEWSPSKDGRPWHVIDQMPTWRGRSILDTPGIEIVRGIDWGYAATGNPGVCLWFAAMPDGSLIGFQEFVFRETLPKDAAEEILARSEGMKVRYTVCDPSMFQAHEGPSVAEHMEQAGLALTPGDNARVAGWVAVHAALRETVDDGTGARPRMRFLRSGCPKTIAHIPTMVVNPRNPEDIVTVGVADDEIDVCRYVAMSRVHPSRDVKPVDPGVAAIMNEIKRLRPGRPRLGAEATRAWR
jgi:hypothetical protein